MADRRARFSRRELRWALKGIMTGHLTVAGVAEGLGAVWDTANDAVLGEGKRALIQDSDQCHGGVKSGVTDADGEHDGSVPFDPRRREDQR